MIDKGWVHLILKLAKLSVKALCIVKVLPYFCKLVLLYLLKYSCSIKRPHILKSWSVSSNIALRVVIVVWHETTSFISIYGLVHHLDGLIIWLLILKSLTLDKWRATCRLINIQNLMIHNRWVKIILLASCKVKLCRILLLLLASKVA